MSRIGRMPIDVPAGVTVTIAADNTVTVKGPLGTLTNKFSDRMTIKQKGAQVIVTRLLGSVSLHFNITKEITYYG